MDSQEPTTDLAGWKSRALERCFVCSPWGPTNEDGSLRRRPRPGDRCFLCDPFIGHEDVAAEDLEEWFVDWGAARRGKAQWGLKKKLAEQERLNVSTRASSREGSAGFSSTTSPAASAAQLELETIAASRGEVKAGHNTKTAEQQPLTVSRMVSSGGVSAGFYLTPRASSDRGDPARFSSTPSPAASTAQLELETTASSRGDVKSGCDKNMAEQGRHTVPRMVSCGGDSAGFYLTPRASKNLSRFYAAPSLAASAAQLELEASYNTKLAKQERLPVSTRASSSVSLTPSPAASTAQLESDSGCNTKFADTVSTTASSRVSLMPSPTASTAQLELETSFSRRGEVQASYNMKLAKQERPTVSTRASSSVSLMLSPTASTAQLELEAPLSSRGEMQASYNMKLAKQERLTVSTRASSSVSLMLSPTASTAQLELETPLSSRGEVLPDYNTKLAEQERLTVLTIGSSGGDSAGFYLTPRASSNRGDSARFSLTPSPAASGGQLGFETTAADYAGLSKTSSTASAAQLGLETSAHATYAEEHLQAGPSWNVSAPSETRSEPCLDVDLTSPLASEEAAVDRRRPLHPLRCIAALAEVCSESSSSDSGEDRDWEQEFLEKNATKENSGVDPDWEQEFLVKNSTTESSGSGEDRDWEQEFLAMQGLG